MSFTTTLIFRDRPPAGAAFELHSETRPDLYYTDAGGMFHFESEGRLLLFPVDRIEMVSILEDGE